MAGKITLMAYLLMTKFKSETATDNDDSSEIKRGHKIFLEQLIILLKKLPAETLVWFPKYCCSTAYVIMTVDNHRLCIIIITQKAVAVSQDTLLYNKISINNI